MESAAISAIKNVCRSTSLHILGKQTGCDRLVDRRLDRRTQLHGERMVYIFLTEWALKIGLRVCYNFSDIAALTSQQLHGNDASSQKKIVDFVKEYANVTGGLMIRSMMSKDRINGISLPVANRVVEPIIVGEERPPKVYKEAWEIARTDGAARIHLLMTIDVVEPEVVDSLVIKEAFNDEKTSDVEFLE